MFNRSVHAWIVLVNGRHLERQGGRGTNQTGDDGDVTGFAI